MCKFVIYNYKYMLFLKKKKEKKKKKNNNYVYVGFNYVSNLIVILFHHFPIFLWDFM